MNQTDIDKLRAAGYSDDDIRDYMANQPQTAPGATQTQPETLPEVDVTKPSQTLSQAEAAGTPTGARESSLIGDVATMAAIKGGQYAVEHPLATSAAALYGASYIPGVNKLPVVSDIRNTRVAVGDIARRATNMARPPAPVAPPIGSPGGVPIGAEVPRPIAPTGMAPAAAPAAPATPQPSMLDRTTAMIRQLAANKVLQNVAKGGVGLTAAMMPGNAGQDYMVPQAGRMRGMEINPMTGRPWTREQLQAYNANPSAFDTALGAAQMPR